MQVRSPIGKGSNEVVDQKESGGKQKAGSKALRALKQLFYSIDKSEQVFVVADFYRPYERSAFVGANFLLSLFATSSMNSSV